MVPHETVGQLQGRAVHRLGGLRSTLHVLSISVSELTIFNPWRMHKGYGSHSVCVYMYLCVTMLTATYLICKSKIYGFIRFLMAFQTHVLCRFC